MKRTKMITGLLAISLALVVTACTNHVTTEEQVQINTMDSTANQAKMIREKLEAQTKDVETSIEKLDKEFSTSK